MLFHETERTMQLQEKILRVIGSLLVQVTMSGKELQEKNSSKSNKLAALFFNKGSNKVYIIAFKTGSNNLLRICVVFRTWLERVLQGKTSELFTILSSSLPGAGSTLSLSWLKLPTNWTSLKSVLNLINCQGVEVSIPKKYLSICQISIFYLYHADDDSGKGKQPLTSWGWKSQQRWSLWRWSSQ